jgi:hypothetical protein
VEVDEHMIPAGSDRNIEDIFPFYIYFGMDGKIGGEFILRTIR